LSFLNEKQLKSTFFIVGSRAISRPDILAAEYMQGHQLSVHTWSHTALTTQTNEQIIAELGWTAKVIKDITGVTPNTMRPPYGDIDDRVRAIAMAMGMTPIIWTTDTSGGNYDTNDWHIPAGTVSASGVINEFGRILADATKLNTGFIVLAHDLYQQSVDLATGYVLPDALARQPPFKLESIITCQHQPLENAYVETNHNDTNPPVGGTGTKAGGTPTGGAQATGAATPMRLADGRTSVGLTALVLGAIGLVL
jgi:peptidoglycan/xylan/chitin deacetylase (PgdA/CDA1 family)